MIPCSWPQKNRKLFIDGENYFESAHFGWGDLQTQTGGYRMGYKIAADTLIENAISSKDISKLDTFVFPALFLYRQYIEITMKGLIISLNDWDDVTLIKKIRSDYGHNLTKLWDDFSKICCEFNVDTNDNAAVIVGEYIKEFMEVDSSSFSFRYPFTRELKLIFGENRKINIKHIKEVMSEIDCFFNGTCDYIYDLKHSGESGYL